MAAKINVVINEDVVNSVMENLNRSLDYLNDYRRVSKATSISELVKRQGFQSLRQVYFPVQR
jgi:hypothetical protein